MDKANAFFDEFGLQFTFEWGFGWESKTLGAHVLLYSLTGQDRYKDLVNSAIDFYLNEAQYTPLGLMFLNDWGSLRN